MPASSSSQKKKVWIDTDIIFNKPGQEVDDALSIMMALNSEIVEVTGISLIHNVDNGYNVTRKLLDFYARYPIPVYKGTDDATQGHGQKTEAVEKLANALQQNELTIAAIGPATNIANLLKFYPEAARNIKDIVFCAGRNQGANFKPQGASGGLPDYNFDMDPDSFKKVVASNLPVTFSGYEASSSIFLQEVDVKKIKQKGRDGDVWVYQMLQPWLERWKQEFNINAFIPFDACTIGHVLAPEYFTYKKNMPVKVNVRANDCRAIVDKDKKPYLEVSNDFSSPYYVNFVDKTNPAYKKVILDHLLGQ